MGGYLGGTSGHEGHRPRAASSPPAGIAAVHAQQFQNLASNAPSALIIADQVGDVTPVGAASLGMPVAVALSPGRSPLETMWA